MERAVKYILKQWIVLKVRSDWPLKLRISLAIYLQATCARSALENIVIVARVINEFKSSLPGYVISRF